MTEEIYTVEEIKKAIEFTESVLQGLDEIISSHASISEETILLFRRRNLILMILNQWKSKLVEREG